MPFADFLQGYGKAIIRLALTAGDFSLIRRGLADGELSEEMRQTLFGGTVSFWATHGDAIDALPGPPGLTKHVSWHAGREFAYVRQRRKDYDPSDWPAGRRALMTANTLALRRLRIRLIAGSLAVEEFDA